MFSFLFPSNLLKLSDKELEEAANRFQKVYKKDVGVDLSHEIVSFRREFKNELSALESVIDVFKLIISSNIMTSVPEEVTAACALFLTLPVTVASAERSFSKLKLIKSYLRSTMAQERLDGLSLLAIERDAAQKLKIDDIVETFAHAKARRYDHMM